MKIGLDATPIYISGGGGIGNYTISIYTKILELDTENEYYLLNPTKQSLLKKYLPAASNLKEWCGKGKLKADMDYFLKHKNEYRNMIQTFVNETSVDIIYFPTIDYIHMPAFDRAYFRGVPVVATIHDWIMHRYADIYLSSFSFCDKVKFYYRSYQVRHVDKILTISNAARKDTLAMFPDIKKENVVNTYEFARTEIVKKAVSEARQKELREKYNLKDNILICVGSGIWHKNIPALVEAFGKVSKDIRNTYSLCVIGKTPDKVKVTLKKIARSLGMSDNLVITGFVDDAVLQDLYNMAQWLVFPSIIEGFGLPMTEAWKCGLPVLTSNNTSLGEIAADAAVLVNPFSVKSIAKGLTRVMTLEADEREKYIRRGQERVKDFDEDKITRKVLDEIYKTAEQKCDKKILLWDKVKDLRRAVRAARKVGNSIRCNS